MDHKMTAYLSKSKGQKHDGNAFGIERFPKRQSKMILCQCFPRSQVLTISGWWLGHPSEKYERHLGWLFPIYGKIKNVQTTNQILLEVLDHSLVQMMDLQWNTRHGTEMTRRFESFWTLATSVWGQENGTQFWNKSSVAAPAWKVSKAHGTRS